MDKDNTLSEDSRGVSNLEEKLAKCESEKEEYLEGWKRAKADFSNYKKEELLRLEEISRFSNEDLVKELIVVMDNFDLGLAALEKSGPVEKGIYMIKAQIENVLAKRGLKKIRVEIGSEFDPAKNEVISQISSGEPPGTIIEEIESGYELSEKIIRPARVKVSKGLEK